MEENFCKKIVDQGVVVFRGIHYPYFTRLVPFYRAVMLVVVVDLASASLVFLLDGTALCVLKTRAFTIHNYRLTANCGGAEIHDPEA